jgi:hypothetical protein
MKRNKTILSECLLFIIGLMIISSCNNTYKAEEPDESKYIYNDFGDPSRIYGLMIRLNQEQKIDSSFSPVLPDSSKDLFINIGANYTIMSYYFYRKDRNIDLFDSLINHNCLFRKYFSKLTKSENADTLYETFYRIYVEDFGADHIIYKLKDSISEEQTSILFGSWLEAIYMYSIFLEKNNCTDCDFMDLTISLPILLDYFKKECPNQKSIIYANEMYKIDSLLNASIIRGKGKAILLENGKTKIIGDKSRFKKDASKALIFLIKELRNKYI